MKILYLNKPQADHLWYMMYRGLREILGDDNVIEFPYNIHHHEETYYHYKARGEIGRQYTVAEIKNMTFDVCIVGNTAHEIENIKEIIPGGESGCTTAFNCPIIMIDGSDSQEVWHSVEIFQPVLIFKREYLLHRQYPANCYPLPFASLFEYGDPLAERPLDVFFAAADTHPRRMIVHRELSKLKINYYGLVSGFRYLDYNTYMNCLKNTKIAITVRGFGYDTVRFWESLACGAMLLAEDTLQIMPNEFVHGKHCVYFDLNTLPYQIEHFLFHNDQRFKIAVDGHEHLKIYHTVKARAQYMLDIIKGFTDSHKSLSGNRRGL